jgi:tripartite ATP-independent transporter DctP family solute receptor
MKKILYLAFCLVFAACMVCQGVVRANPIKLKLATVTPPYHAYNEGAREFARLVKEGTGGEIDIRIYPGGQLGSGEREIVEGLQVGTIDLVVTSTGPLSNFCPDMGVVDLPFLFLDYEHVDKVLDGELGRELLDGLEAAQLKGLAFMENGFRNFTNSVRPLRSPADFKGLKFRTMENPVHLASVRALGAQAVPMSWGEVYTSLQTGVIDGQENPVAVIHDFKLNEVQKYMSLTGHFYSPAPLIMSLKKFQSLKPEWQDLFLKAAAEAARFERKVIRENEQDQIEDLKSWGMEIITVDKEPFVKAEQVVYERFFEQSPHWERIVQTIRSMQ